MASTWISLRFAVFCDADLMCSPIRSSPFSSMAQSISLATAP